VAVNLFNGNAQYKNAGPAFETVGGSAGVTFFGFNSRQGGEAHGYGRVLQRFAHKRYPDTLRCWCAANRR